MRQSNAGAEINEVDHGILFGKAALPTKRSLRKTGVKDVDRGLNLKLRIANYTSNRETQDFIVE